MADCPLHVESSDNRGIAAWFKAGMPSGFPVVARCLLCGTDGLLYPNVELDDPNGSGEFQPTLICPRCSAPAAERSLRAEAEAFGYELNDQSVFGARAAA